MILDAFIFNSLFPCATPSTGAVVVMRDSRSRGFDVGVLMDLINLQGTKEYEYHREYRKDLLVIGMDKDKGSRNRKHKGKGSIENPIVHPFIVHKNIHVSPPTLSSARSIPARKYVLINDSTFPLTKNGHTGDKFCQSEAH